MRARVLAEQVGVPPDRIAGIIEELRERGLLARENGGPKLTADGRALAARAIAARREMLTEALGDKTADRDPAVSDLLQRLAREFTGEPPARAA